LVAAAYAHGARTPTANERRLLEQLEAADPPSLTFPDADVNPAADVFVPVNDEKNRVVFNDKKGRTRGVLHPNRQVRQFPTAFLLGDPEVTLTWSLDMDDASLAVLDGIASRLTHVGTSHSMATAKFIRPEGTPVFHWVPNDVHGTQYLRITRQGRLAELDRLATEGAGTVRRPQPLHEVLMAYAPVQAERRVIPSTHTWIGLRLLDAAWGADTAHTLARAVRRAVMSILGDDAPAAVHGHDATVAHLAWLPLADVGHSFARGKIRGLGVGLPKSMSPRDQALALAGLARLDKVVLPDAQIARVMASVDGPETPTVLRSNTWLGPSTHWSTVTPVLLDRPPKRHEPAQLVAAVTASLRLAGLPEPVSVEVSSSSDFDGAPDALAVPTRIPRFHVRVVFADQVEGPVIAGRWKNFGIGLFRPTPKEFRT
jgi:CRISPR-associated protein Csb2